MLPALKRPMILTNKDGTRELVWYLPKTFSEKAQDLFLEHKLIVKLTDLDDETMLTLKFMDVTQKNHVMFCMFLFTQHYTKCATASKMLEKTSYSEYINNV
jgi:hypothetical protein